MKPANLTPYNKIELLKVLSQFKVSQNPIDRKVRTYMGKQKISEYQPGTKHYQLVDFGKVGKKFLDQIETAMTCKNSNLSISGGIQELRIYGDTVMVGKDEYTEMASIISSTNGMRRFSIFAGLYRLICSNGAYITTKDSIVHTARHYKSNETILKAMEFDFGNIKNAFEGTRKEIEKLVGKKVKLSTLKKALVEKDGENAKKFLSFIAKLNSSRTDKLEVGTDITVKDSEKLNKMKTPKDLLKINPANDMSLDAYKVFQCYTELFRAATSDIILKETDKVLAALAA